MAVRWLLLFVVVMMLSACGLFGTAPSDPVSSTPATRGEATEKGREVAMFAMGLLDTGYRFGGKNPEAGLDCSGMVSYVYNQAIGLKITGSAADIARKGQSIARESLRPGDLVFFNTRKFSFSHVGIYIGENRFVHAPSSNGKVRIDLMTNKYYAQRFESARSYFD